MRLFFYLFIFLIPIKSYAHTFTGMVGFFDGISHPVLGLDHFIAMVSVGIISAQIGGRAIWTIPSTFILLMIVGGSLGIYIENQQLLTSVNLFEISKIKILEENEYLFIEIGILISVISLGLVITIEKNLPFKFTIIFICFFGFCHGSAHGLEMPRAFNPLLFALGFSSGSAILHLFGVVIGYLSNRKKTTSIILRSAGFLFVVFGFYKLTFLFL